MLASGNIILIPSWPTIPHLIWSFITTITASESAAKTWIFRVAWRGDFKRPRCWMIVQKRAQHCFMPRIFPKFQNIPIFMLSYRWKNTHPLVKFCRKSGALTLKKYLTIPWLSICRGFWEGHVNIIIDWRKLRVRRRRWSWKYYIFKVHLHQARALPSSHAFIGSPLQSKLSSILNLSDEIEKFTVVFRHRHAEFGDERWTWTVCQEWRPQRSSYYHYYYESDSCSLWLGHRWASS